jgi:hypothetical protein
VDIQVAFDPAQRIAGLFFVPYPPPSYVKPNAFRETEVMVGTGEWALAGTLTLPLGPSVCPAVLLVHGSGPHDRDETVGATKPFRDLAWGLGSQGIAVLRYEKRTKQHAAKLGAIGGPLTVKDETIDDVLAAVALLRQTEGIETTRIFVLGHSLVQVPTKGGRKSCGLGHWAVTVGHHLGDRWRRPWKRLRRFLPCSDQRAPAVSERVCVRTIGPLEACPLPHRAPRCALVPPRPMTGWTGHPTARRGGPPGVPGLPVGPPSLVAPERARGHRRPPVLT